MARADPGLGTVAPVSDIDEVIDFYAHYGRSAFDDEPAYAEICARLAEHRDLAAVIAAHAPEARQPNLLFAAVHFLLLGGLRHPLADVYAGTSSAAPAPLFEDLVLSHRSAVDDLLATRRTQTNEVGRSAVLALLLADARRRSPASPPAWIDLGTSGGLNLNGDRYRTDYRFGDRTVVTGAVDSAVRLDCEVRSGNPPIERVPVDLGWRVGVDRAPVDVTVADEARWLRACLWPGRAERHDRLEAAIEIARRHPPSIIGADAGPGVAEALARAPRESTIVMTTTWVWFYLPEATRGIVLDQLRQDPRRVLWYSLEGRGVVAELGLGAEVGVDESIVGVVDFGEHEQATVLADAHPHGAWIEWH